MRKSPSQPIILVFVGEKLSGKEKSARYLIRGHQFKGLRFSQILVDILIRLRLPVTRPNEAQLVGALRERFGGGVLATVIKTEIERRRLKRVVVDGLRHPAEYDILKRLPGFKLVYLTAPLAARYRRALARREKVGESELTLDEFKQEEKLPTELFIKSLGRKADVKLVNDGALVDLYQQIEQKIIKNLK